MRTVRFTAPLAVLLSTAAFAGPAAAMPLDSGRDAPSANPTAEPVVPIDARPTGFDWASAAIGAAGGAGAFAIVLAGSAGARRRRGPLAIH
jgi:hypothetical protein